ncbi:hypothetical protein TNCV_1823451 [Trichonephila clavipes]|nr:hypothetical protein TNCV_1823451 [Trichonephila clavipes]
MPSLPVPTDDAISQEFIKSSALKQVVAIHSGTAAEWSGLISSQYNQVEEDVWGFYHQRWTNSNEFSKRVENNIADDECSGRYASFMTETNVNSWQNREQETLSGHFISLERVHSSLFIRHYFTSPTFPKPLMIRVVDWLWCELVAGAIYVQLRAQIQVKLKTYRVEGLIKVKSIENQSSHIGEVWKFGECDIRLCVSLAQ